MGGTFLLTPGYGLGGDGGPVPMRQKEPYPGGGMHEKHGVPVSQSGGSTAFDGSSSKYATMRGSVYLKEGMAVELSCRT